MRSCQETSFKLVAEMSLLPALLDALGLHLTEAGQ